MKYNFNEKVFNLKQRKIKFIHDKKQFNYDIDTIQNELNDSKLTLVDFPEGSIDELFIDVSKKENLTCLPYYTNRQYKYIVIV